MLDALRWCCVFVCVCVCTLQSNATEKSIPPIIYAEREINAFNRNKVFWFWKVLVLVCFCKLSGFICFPQGWIYNAGVLAHWIWMKNESCYFFHIFFFFSFILMMLPSYTRLFPFANTTRRRFEASSIKRNMHAQKLSQLVRFVERIFFHHFLFLFAKNIDFHNAHRWDRKKKHTTCCLFFVKGRGV